MPATLAYRRREPEKTILYGIVRDHLEEFLQTADTRSGQARSLPRYVRNAFTRFLDCGILAKGFVRVRCRTCGHEGVVGFSCKERGICPSCTGRRMAETAAHLTDRVFPAVPVRQWVLSMPYDIRFLLARDANLLASAERIFVSEVFRHLRRKAGVRRARDAPTGAVTAVQRFGGALNLNVHFHTLFLDGVYRPDSDTRELRFQKLPPPAPEEMDVVLMRIRGRIHKQLEHRGHVVDPDAPPGAEAPNDDSTLLDVIQSGSVRGWTTLEDKPRPVCTAGGDGERAALPEAKPFTVLFRGWTLHAGVRMRAGDREGIEHLCRYILRPPLSEERLERLPDGKIAYRFRNPWPNGKTHAIFKPVEFMEKLAAIVPPPRSHLVRYHGVLAPNHRMRAKVVPVVRPRTEGEFCGHDSESTNGCGGREPRVVAGPEDIEVKSAGKGDCPPPSLVGRQGECLPCRSPEGAKAGPLFRGSRTIVYGDGKSTSDGGWVERPRGSRRGRPHMDWARLLKRSMHLDALECPKCGEKMAMIAVIKDLEVARKILVAMGLPSKAPVLARAPPAKEAVEFVQDSEIISRGEDDVDAA